MEQLLNILKQHNVEARESNGSLIVKDEYTINGKYQCREFILEASHESVARFLGY